MFDPQRLAELLRQADPELRFTLIDIGAVPLGEPEPFHRLIDDFPGSRMIGFEVDTAVCERLNRSAPPGFEYHALAIGRKDEVRPFYVTRNPVCSSLYRPNEDLIRRFNHMEIALLERVETIRTRGFDEFAAEHRLGTVDLLKIDIQGAELDAFEGAVRALGSVLAIVCEVEFLPHYVDQPLFGDVCAWLAERGFTFHRFVSVGRSTLKPFALPAHPLYATHDIWADAMYLRDPGRRDALDKHGLLKLAVLANLYGSIDVTYVCLRDYDQRCGTALAAALERMPARLDGSRL